MAQSRYINSSYKLLRDELSVIDDLLMRGDGVVLPSVVAALKIAQSTHQGIVKDTVVATRMFGIMEWLRC